METISSESLQVFSVPNASIKKSDLQMISQIGMLIVSDVDYRNYAIAVTALLFDVVSPGAMPKLVVGMNCVQDHAED